MRSTAHYSQFGSLGVTRKKLTFSSEFVLNDLEICGQKAIRINSDKGTSDIHSRRVFEYVLKCSFNQTGQLQATSPYTMCRNWHQVLHESIHLLEVKVTGRRVDWGNKRIYQDKGDDFPEWKRLTGFPYRSKDAHDDLSAIFTGANAAESNGRLIVVFARILGQYPST